MKLTQELIDKIQEAMLHTNLKGEINWKDGDDIEVQIAELLQRINLLLSKTNQRTLLKMLSHTLTLIMRKKYLQKMVEKNIKKN